MGQLRGGYRSHCRSSSRLWALTLNFSKISTNIDRLSLFLSLDYRSLLGIYTARTAMRRHLRYCAACMTVLPETRESSVNRRISSMLSAWRRNMITPVIINKPQWKAYLIFMCTNLAFIPLCYFCDPDKADMTLEEIDFPYIHTAWYLCKEDLKAVAQGQDAEERWWEYP